VVIGKAACYPALFMTVRRDSPFLVKRISYLASDDEDTLFPSCASRFTNDERRRVCRSSGSAIAAEAFMNHAG